MTTALIIAAILAAPVVPGVLVACWIMTDELLNGGHDQ